MKSASLRIGSTTDTIGTGIGTGADSRGSDTNTAQLVDRPVPLAAGHRVAAVHQRGRHVAFDHHHQRRQVFYFMYILADHDALASRHADRRWMRTGRAVIDPFRIPDLNRVD